MVIGAGGAGLSAAIEAKLRGASVVVMTQGDLFDCKTAAKVVFEASCRASQGYFVQLLGANVNIGNVSATDAMILESLRSGLLFETLAGE